VLVSPTTFDSILQARARRGAPPTWAIAISNRGDIESGATRTSAVKALLEHSPGTSAGQVIAVKQTALDQARSMGKGFRDMFTGTGMFGVLAGLLLLINLFVMLAEERKPELGMARAVGMSRKSLVGAFVTEGWFYALVATALGTVAGIGLGRVLVTVSERVFSTSHNRFELFFNVVPGSIATAFAISLAVAVLSVLVMSIRVSRLNIIRAIRDIPEPPSRRNDRRRLLVGGLTLAAGAAWAATAMPANRPAAVLLAPMLVAAGIVPLVSRFTPSRVPASTCAVAVILWGALVFRFDNAAAEGAGIMIFVAQGIALTTAAVVLASLQQDKIGAVLRRLVARRSLSARLGLAYPLARRSRTGLTVAMYALVVFILTFIATIAHLINAQVDTTARQLSGGYDVVFSSSAANPVDPTSLASTKGVVRVAPLGTTTASFTVLGVASDERWRLTTFDRRFIDKAPPQLDDRGQYPSDAAAWQAVLRDPNLIIVDSIFLQRAGGPPAYQVSIGMTMTLANPSTGAWRTVRVAAISVADGFINNGALYGAPGGRSLFGALVTPNRAYVALAPGVDPDRFAAALQARHFRNGVEASSIRALVDEGFAVTNQMFQLFEGYLALGLVVGVAGLGVVMVRAVRERRRQIGTLRAIGFSSKTVGRSFALEGGFIAIEGTVIGVSLALVTLYSIVAGGEAFGPLAFTVPILMLAVLLVGTIAASLLATVGPALSATKTRPAVALRITD
jgi:putative ABC transport system permease protein